MHGIGTEPPADEEYADAGGSTLELLSESTIHSLGLGTAQGKAKERERDDVLSMDK
jgi:hypothetical protein